ncbi:MAG TPA: hypothetical protein VKP30_18655 [Polyangiaceae bacterium]|nr:hypothetical protein [Polyangiaceae bacterium]
MRFGRLRFTLLAAVYTLPARAEDAPAQGVRLSFVRAENASGCIALTALEQELARRMGRNPFVGLPRQWIEGVATKTGAYFEVQLFERDAEGHTVGTRRLRDASGDCRKLDDAIELAIALIIDPSVRLAPLHAAQVTPSSSVTQQAQPRAAESTAGPTARADASDSLIGAHASSPPSTGAVPLNERRASNVQPESQSADVVTMNGGAATAPATRGKAPEQRDPCVAVAPLDVHERQVTSVSRAATSELTPVARDDTNKTNLPSAIPVFVFADAVLASGVLPRPALGIELGTRIAFERMQRWSLRVGGLFLPQQQDTSAQGDFSYGLTALELGLCFNTHARRITGFGCASPGFGAVHAVVNAPAPFEPGDRLWFAVRIEAGVAIQVAGPVWLEARGFDWIAPLRWQFRVKTEQGPRPVFRQNGFMPGAALGLALKFD